MQGVAKTAILKPEVWAAVLFCLLAVLELSDRPYLATADIDFSNLLPPPMEGSAAEDCHNDYTRAAGSPAPTLKDIFKRANLITGDPVSDETVAKQIRN